MLFEQLVLAARGFLAGVPVGRGVLGGQAGRLVGLKFYGVGSACGGLVNEPAGNFHAALVVHAGFGDDVGRGNARFRLGNSKYIHNIHGVSSQKSFGLGVYSRLGQKKSALSCVNA